MILMVTLKSIEKHVFLEQNYKLIITSAFAELSTIGLVVHGLKLFDSHRKNKAHTGDVYTFGLRCLLS